MSAVLNSTHPQEAANEQDDESTLLEKFASRQSRELVIAFAGPIGCGIASVINATEEILRQKLGYVDVVSIKLSDFLSQSIRDGNVPTPNLESKISTKYRRYRELQQAGMDLRGATGNQAILAEYAIKSIVVHRGQRNPTAMNDAREPVVPNRVAYLIDQVKRPEEVALLRALYRNLFYVVGVTKNYTQRVDFLANEGVKTDEIKDLIDIDRNEDADTGQKLDKTLHLADYFLRNDAGVDKSESIERFLRLIHGDKSKTPTVIEQGMYAAYAAGLRSACLSRQVGAAIGTRTGEVLATGCNDVPMAGGGLYRAGLDSDNRCVHLKGQICFNDVHKKKLVDGIELQINQSLQRSVNGEEAVAISEARKKDLIESIFRKTAIRDLIEFSRSVHAEMDAIVSLARAGGVGVKGTTLYTTTFPCHSCARHIVAAGIADVYYIEPYEKSLASELHSDAISFEFNNEQTAKNDRVRFLHFEGISPRQFSQVFRSPTRKDKNGVFIPIENETAEKILPEYLDDYQVFEKKAVEHFQADVAKLNSQKTS
ncbi:anti-phage dCTP deaminase [Variovorax sp. H27-G14]|uniref:anti-phage dCTP deaminase n=1 Tax=Variovorax sp. H27-G14 TaxID=3111914 RepID=UPI0038FD187C